MHSEIQGSIVIISHQERILNIADYVILMKNGKVEKITTASEIIGSSNNVKAECFKLNGKN